MIKIFTFLLFFSGCVCSLSGQNDWHIIGKSIPQLRQTTQPTPTLNFWNQISLTSVSEKQKSQVLASPATFPQWYSENHLPFFCKMEVKMEKTFKFPVKVRLGEVQYVEKMEGKPNY